MMRFYEIITDPGKRKRFAYGIGLGLYPSKEINCDVCGRRWQKELHSDDKFKLKIVLSNSYFSDVLGYEHYKLVSQKTKEILVDEHVKGYYLQDNIHIVSLDEISLEKQTELSRKGYKVKEISTNPPRYYNLYANGIAKLHEKSNIHLIEECNICFFKKYVSEGKTYIDPDNPLYISEASWDGNDFFRVEEMPAVIFCTEKVFEIYKKYNLTGLVFKEVGSV